MSARSVSRKKREKLILAGIILWASFIRIVSLSISDDFHGIAAGKVFAAQGLIKYPYIFETWITPPHGPIHLYLITLALKLFGNPLFVPRLLSLFAGIALFFPYYYFVKLCFDKDTALISSFICAFFPLHIMYSVLSTAESTFLFFLISALFFYTKYASTQDYKDLVISAALIGISSMCRFEGGLFIIILSSFLIKKWEDMMLFVSIASILPVVWMVCNYLYGGNFLFFLASSDSIVRTEYDFLRTIGENPTFFKKIFYWPFQIKAYFGWPIFTLGIFGFIAHGYRKSKKLFLLLLSMLVFFSFKTVSEELAMQPRYGISLGVLFVPFFGYAFTLILNKFKKEGQKIVLALFFLFVLFRGTYLTILYLPHTPDWVKQAGVFLNKNLAANDAVYIEADEDNLREPLKLYCGVDWDRFIDKNPFLNHMELMAAEGRERLKYIVLISTRKLKNKKKVFEMNDCKIYEVERKDENEK